MEKGSPGRYDKIRFRTYVIMRRAADNPLSLVQQYSPSVSMSIPMPTQGTRLPNKTMRVPHYSAGFFMDGSWFEESYLPRCKLATRKAVLNNLVHDQVLYVPELFYMTFQF